MLPQRQSIPIGSTSTCTALEALRSATPFCSLFNSSPKPQAPTTSHQPPEIPMRLSHFFVVVAAAFLATGALADNNNVVSINEPSHRNLRKHHKIEEERGINNIPLERLHSLGRKVGVNADDVLADAAAAMRSMTERQQKKWMNGLSALLKRYKRAKSPRIADN